MRSQRSVLALRYTPVSVAGGVRRAVGGFIRYVQHRDQHREPDTTRAVDAYVRYVAHRDRTSPGGRVFSRDGDADRRGFVDSVTRSTKGLKPMWVVTKDGKRVDRQRAVYSFILSPEDWRGLDLRQLARVAMKQLESDAGAAGIGPWFAAEHRNTAHHHVHIVLAARRELADGRFSTLVINRQRLQRMKDSIALEIERQRSRERAVERKPYVQPRIHTPERIVVQPPAHQRASRWRSAAPKQARDLVRPGRHRRVGYPIAPLLHLRAVARRYHDRIQRELEGEQIAERTGRAR